MSVTTNSLSMSIGDFSKFSILPCKKRVFSTILEEMLDFDGLPERFNPDEITFHELKACEICEQTFNMTIRRHHCRRCGKSVCSKCSGNMKPLSKVDQKTAYRICDACDTEIENFKVLLND
jgi:hypothetical protein